MKTRLTLAFVVALIVVSAGVWWLLKPTLIATRKPVVSAQSSPAPQQNTTAISSPTPSKVEIAAAYQVREQERFAELRDIIRWKNAPIKFWGRVVDQNEKPLEGVHIRVHTRKWDEVAPGKEIAAPIYTDLVSSADGHFELTNGEGDLLAIDSMDKEGYELSPKAPKAFGYRNHPEIFTPRIDNPVTFKMWQGREAEGLVSADKFYGIIPDGRIYTIDLLGAKKAEDANAPGDIRVQIKRPVQVAPQTKYDWSAVIEGIGGGVIESTDDFMYEAPADGYQPRYELEMKTSDPHWNETVRKQFYVRSRDGKVYARLQVEMISKYREQAVFNIQYFANPSGSRNLEYDPAKQVGQR